MHAATLEAIRVPVRLASPKTTWPVICDGCGRYSEPGAVRMVTIARSDHLMCAKCWKKLAA